MQVKIKVTGGNVGQNQILRGKCKSDVRAEHLFIQGVSKDKTYEVRINPNLLKQNPYKEHM